MIMCWLIFGIELHENGKGYLTFINSAVSL